jgi:hypothetical protein
MVCVALQSGSQEFADVFEPKTRLFDMKYDSSAMNPKASVTSADIHWKRKQAVMSARARYLTR